MAQDVIFLRQFTAFLARNFSIIDAFKLANNYVRDSLQNALKIGKGLLVSNPASSMYDYASRYVVLKGLNGLLKISKRPIILAFCYLKLSQISHSLFRTHES